jgi:AcrR family transcriptional regulator
VPSSSPKRQDPKKRRTQAERRDAARTAILETAIELLAAGGYASMTLADLGERAGYSRSLAAHYYGSKPELLRSIVEYVLVDSPPTRMSPDMTGLDRVEAEIQGLFYGLTNRPARARAYIVIAHEAATALAQLRPIIHAQNLALRHRVEAAIRQGMELGTVRTDVDPETVALAIAAAARGITWEWFTDPALDLDVSHKALIDNIRLLAQAPPGRRQKRR